MKSAAIELANEADKLVAEIQTTALPDPITDDVRDNLGLGWQISQRLTRFSREIRTLASGLKESA